MECEGNLFTLSLDVSHVFAVGEVAECLSVNTDLAISIDCNSRNVSMLHLDAGLDSCNEPVLDTILRIG